MVEHRIARLVLRIALVSHPVARLKLARESGVPFAFVVNGCGDLQPRERKEECDGPGHRSLCSERGRDSLYRCDHNPQTSQTEVRVGSLYCRHFYLWHADSRIQLAKVNNKPSTGGANRQLPLVSVGFPAKRKMTRLGYR